MAKEIIEAEIKSNIGEVSEGIDKATKSTKKLGKETEGVGEASKKSAGGVKKLTVGFKALAKASGVVFLLNKAFEIFQEVLGKNQRIVDLFGIAMESLSIAFNDLFSYLSGNVGKVTGWFKDMFENPAEKIRELGDTIKDAFIDRFNQALEVLGLVAKSFGQLIDGEFRAAFETIKEAGKETVDVFTGVDKSYEQVAKTIKNYVSTTIDAATATIELNKAAELAAVQVQGLIEDYDRQAEKLRQVRDDETKTFAERIEANTRLGEVLKEQGVEMQKLVDIQVNAAQVEFNKNQSQENLIALTEALNERKAVEAQITGFQSEQLTNQVSLEKELGETKRELLLSGLEGMALELAELQTSYDLKIEMARKAGEDTTAITEKFESDQSAIKKKYEKEKETWSKMSSAAQLDIMSQTAGNMVKILGEETAAGKAMAVTQATIDTYRGATAAYASLAGIPVVGPVLGGVAAAAAVASGIANVNAILATGGGGGGSAPSGGSVPTAGATAPAPEMMSGAFELGGGQAPEPVKAFVVTDEMSNSQDQLANIRRRATI
tara:strand:- start:1240 stop:2889 length:1650 start_codon:yes stop_codon:yes gene_type:complete